MRVERFDDQRQRQALNALADPSFLTSAEGAAFLEQIRLFIAPGVVGANRKWGFHTEPEDVVHSMIVKLLEEDGKIAGYALTASSPWGYLFTCAMGWAQKERGHRGVGIEAADTLSAFDVEEQSWTPLEQVVALTFMDLAERTPAELHTDLREALAWLAVNPAQRLSYELDERQALHRFCPRFTIDQVKAVMNIAWGGRPQRERTSLFGGYLLDPAFSPLQSPTHARALKHFRAQMLASQNGSRSLKDWM